MVEVNFAAREVVCKIVYYGPGRSGKTTNLENIHAQAPSASVGELLSVATETDRTIFFDLLALDMGRVAGMKTKFQLYTVPGQVHYNASRKVVLQGADGVVFVADSGPGKEAENLESLENLWLNMRENGLDPETTPIVFQWNKRDLPGVISEAALAKDLNAKRRPEFSSVATTGRGVLETLKGIAELVVGKLNRELADGKGVTTAGRSTAAAAVPSRRAAPGMSVPVVCKSPARVLLENLVRRGLLPPGDCAPLLEAARVTRRPVCLLMLAMETIDETTLAEMLISACNLPYVDLSCYSVAPEVIAVADPALCWEHKLLPLDLTGGTVSLGMVDPLDDRSVSRLAAPRNLSPCRAVVLKSEFTAAFARHFPDWPRPDESGEGDAAVAALTAARAALASAGAADAADPIGEIPEWFGGELEAEGARATEDVLESLPGWLDEKPGGRSRRRRKRGAKS
jgi:signal recognition particle receptor subunit beta